MASPQDLFKLVKSMTKAEKRFFRLLSSHNEGTKNYIRLWEVLDKMGSYDEEVLRKKLQGERFLSNLSYEKNYLQHQLLRSLRIFHEDSDRESTLRNRLQEGRILHEKGLLGFAQKWLEKTNKMAREMECLELEMEILIMQERITIESGDIKYTEGFIHKAYEEKRRILEQMEEVVEMDKLHSQYLLYIKKENLPETSHDFDKVLSAPILAKDQELKTILGKRLKYHIFSISEFFNRDWEKSTEWMEKILEVIEANPGYKEAKPRFYSATLINMGGRYLIQHKEKKFFETIAKMREFSQKKDSAYNRLYKAKAMSAAIQLEIEFATAYLPIEPFMKKLPVMLEEWEAVESAIPVENKMTFYTSLGTLYFYVKEYKKSLRAMNNLLQLGAPTPLRIDLKTTGRIIRALCYFELEDERGWELNLNALYKEIELYKFNHPTVKFFFNMMKENIQKSGMRIPKDGWKKIEQKIQQELEERPADNAFFISLRLQDWIKKKLK